MIKEYGLDRDEIVVATKVHFAMREGRPNGAGSSRKNIMAEIDHSLKRLGLDYVDLYQIHRLGYSMAQVSLAWMLSKPYVTSPIVGFTSEKHVEEAVSALDIKLSDDIIKRLEEPYVPHIQTGLY